MAKTMKTAIAIPKEDFHLIEEIRKETGKSRSQILIDAFHEHVKARRMKQWEKEYEDAYRRKPETKEEIQESTRLTAAERAAWPQEDW